MVRNRNVTHMQPGPMALPSPLRPPSHVVHEAMLLHSSSPHAPDASPSGSTCWHCSPPAYRGGHMFDAPIGGLGCQGRSS